MVAKDLGKNKMEKKGKEIKNITRINNSKNERKGKAIADEWNMC